MNHLNRIKSAMRDADDLTKWAEPNNALYNDEMVEQAVLGALCGQPVPTELAMGQPLMWFVTGEVDLPVPFIQGLVALSATVDHALCGRCGARRFAPNRLLVPAGGSVVCLFVCGPCHDALNDDYPDLVWEATP